MRSRTRANSGYSSCLTPLHGTPTPLQGTQVPCARCTRETVRGPQPQRAAEGDRGRCWVEGARVTANSTRPLPITPLCFLISPSNSSESYISFLVNHTLSLTTCFSLYTAHRSSDASESTGLNRNLMNSSSESLEKTVHMPFSSLKPDQTGRQVSYTLF